MRKKMNKSNNSDVGEAVAAGISATVGAGAGATIGVSGVAATAMSGFVSGGAATTTTTILATAGGGSIATGGGGMVAGVGAIASSAAVPIIGWAIGGAAVIGLAGWGGYKLIKKLTED